MTLARRAAARAYALALWSFPPQHRAIYAVEMVEAFDRNLANEARDRGAARALRFVIAACFDAVPAGLGERRRRRAADQASTRGHFLGGVGLDFKHAVRGLATTRTFTFVCVVSLGVGLGVVFSMAMFLRGLTATPPGVDEDVLVELVVTPLGPLRATAGNWAIETWSYQDFEDLRDADTGMALTGWVLGDGMLRSADVAPQRVSSMYVSANYFSSVGLVPAQGRIFNAADEGGQARPVLIVSHRLWEDRLGADPAVIGSTLTLNRVEYTVVGVAPAGFLGHLNRREIGRTDIWVPLRSHPALATTNELLRNRGADWLRVLGRLSLGTTLVDANGAVSLVMSDLAEQFPASNEYKAASVEPYTSTGTNQRLEMGIVKTMFFGLSGMVLLVVCLNVAGMVLVRSAIRERELAVRLALGASRGRLVRYLMTEAVVLALVGASVSVAVVYSGTATLAWWLDFPIPDAWRLNASRVAACMALSLGTTLVFGLLPSIRFSRPKILTAIKADTGGGGGRRVGRVHRVAVAVQAGLALPFLVMGGLLVDGARTTVTADLGFEPEGLFASAMSVEAAGYAGEEAGFFLRSVQDNLRRAGGVTSVTVADGLPLDYNLRPTRVSLEGGGARVRGHTTRVGEDYLETLGTPLLRGRGITDSDRAGAELVAVISESLATRLFPDKEAVGERLVSALQGTTEDVFTVVGVTADVATSQLQTTLHQVFVPLAQHPAPRTFLIARASADSQSMTTAFEKAIADLDPGFGRPNLVTGATLVRNNIDDLLQQSSLAMVVALVALTLSALGIYGVVAFMVATRTREIGVRIALGASRRRVVAVVLTDAFKLILPGLVLGLILAVVAVRETGLIWNQLGAVQPVVYTAAVCAAVAVALLASIPSARRAASVEPLDAMRSE